MSVRSSENTIVPGEWLGVFGGGQLGRMFTHVAQRLGYHVAVFDPTENCPAGQSADVHYCSNDSVQSDEDLVQAMASRCSAITLEFENIPASLVDLAATHTVTAPGAEFLRMCQHRILEKGSLVNAGFPATPFRAVACEGDVVAAGEVLGWPMVLKTAESGYDGKGQAVVRSAAEIAEKWSLLNSSDVIAEKWIPFVAEVSMIVARNTNDEVVAFPLFENRHANHILDVTICPVGSTLQQFESQAFEICRGIAKRFGVVGIFCVEFFVTESGDLIINEIAPRPHNSGHLTIEAFNVSQFELQVRAMCNLPLVRPTQLAPAAMVNLLGDVWEHGEPNWNAVLSQPSAYLHLYGKNDPKAGRKMGHVTVMNTANPTQLAEQLRRQLYRK